MKSQKLRPLITPVRLFALFAALQACLLIPAQGAQNPPGCSANNLTVNIAVDANNVTNGSMVTWRVTVWNPPDPTSCDVTLGPEGLFFVCPGPDGLPTGTRTTLIPGNTTLPPGYGITNFFITCQVLLSGGAQSAIGRVSAPGSVVHKNPLRDDPADVDKTISVNIFRPCIGLTTQCLSAQNANGAEVVVTYTGTVNNCGNVFLENVVVLSDQPAPNTVVFGPMVLQAGASATFTVSYTNRVNLCGPFVTALNASGTAPLDFPVVMTASASSQCSIGYNPVIRVTKVCPPQPVQPGGLLTFSGVVRNEGDIVLTNVMVYNNLPSENTPLLPAPITLPVGASVEYTGSYVVPADSCPPYASTVTARGTSSCGAQIVTHSATLGCPGENSPAIQLTKACPPQPVVPGGTLTYTGTVTNTGNITLTDVVVLSDRPVAGTRVFGPATLPPGAGAAFTGSYAVAADSCGPYTSTLTTSGKDKCFGVLVNDLETLSCPGITTPAIRVTKSCPAAPVQPGGTLTYSGTVANTGNITLTNVTVMNTDLNKRIYGPASLLPGATANFTDSYVVPVDSCGPYSDTLVAEAMSACGFVVNNTVTVACPGTNTPAIRVTRACPAEPVQPGGLLAYSGTVTNTGNVTLTGVVVTSAQNPETPVFGPVTLPAGAGASFVGSYVVPVDSCGPYADTLTARGADVCFDKLVTHAATSSCPGANSPAIEVQQQCPETPTPMGAPLIFRATVANRGNITLTNIVVVNNWPAANTVVFRAVSLAPGQSTNFTGQFTVPANLNACSITNTLRVTGANKCSGPAATSSVTTICTVVSSPAINVAQFCPATRAVPGGLFTFTGAVTNTGNVRLTDVQVVVDQPAPNTVVFVTNSLPPGGWARFTGSYIAPVDACSVSHTVVARGTETCGTVVTDAAPLTCLLATSPAISISRICPDAAVAPGQEMALLGWITNRGNIALTNVTVVVDKPQPNTLFFGPVVLAPGQAAGFVGSFTVPTNATGCSIAYTLTVRGNDQCSGAVVSANAAGSCPILTLPGITITKSCPPAPVPQGSLLTYRAGVTNTGNITLNNIVVYRTDTGTNTVVFRAASLAPGRGTNFTGSYRVPTDCCTVTATLLATGIDACSGSNTADTVTTICPVQFTPRVVITKSCPATPTAIGSVLTYSGTVSNAGNITLTGVTVYNSVTGRDDPVLGLAALAPRESVPYSGSYIVANDFCGNDTVTVEGESLCGDMVSHQVSTTCPILTAPAIAVMRNCPTQPIVQGAPVTFSGTVINLGNVTLNDVAVFDSMPTNNTVVLRLASLAPGQSANFTYTYIAPLNCNCCELVETLSARGQDRCSGRIVTATSTVACPYQTTPSILVVLECPASGGNIGDTVAYHGTVMNNGDITLTNVFVRANLPNLPGEGTRLVGPLTLARGETQDFAASYVVTAASPLSALIVTATGVDPCRGVTVADSDNCAGDIVPAPVLAAPQVIEGSITLRWSSKAGATYRVQSTSSLSAGWQNEQGDVTAYSDVCTKTLNVGSAARQYYRIIVVQ